MADRNELIASLEGRVWGGEMHKGGYIHVPQEEAEAILELLKEQEPRVLTLEEAKKAEVCWLEQRGYEPYVTDDADTWNPEIYGKAYRCWSAKPTDEQRKAEKWE